MTKSERLATFIKDLRGSQSQRQFAKLLGVSQGSITVWESGQAWPEIDNLEKLALFKGWSLQQLQKFLVEGVFPPCESPKQVSLEQILESVRSLPSEAVAKIAVTATETLAARSLANPSSRKLLRKVPEQKPALSA